MSKKYSTKDKIKILRSSHIHPVTYLSEENPEAVDFAWAYHRLFEQGDFAQEHIDVLKKQNPSFELTPQLKSEINRAKNTAKKDLLNVSSEEVEKSLDRQRKPRHYDEKIQYLEKLKKPCG